MANSSPNNSYVLGLDIGDKRIGVAIASTIARLPRPLEHIENGPNAFEQITKLAANEGVEKIVAGLPRSLDGQETAQSQKAREFVARLQKQTTIPIEFAEESLSTVRAEKALKTSKNTLVSADSIAACYILEEFFISHGATQQ